MTGRVVKQIIYGALYLGILAAVAAAVYFNYIAPEPSCFDFIQNQNEEGIDCGGVCAKKCLPSSLQQIKSVDRILVMQPSQSAMTILGRVSNPNLDLAAKSFTYTFALLGSGDEIIQSFRGESFIYAGEVKHLLVPNVPYPAAPFTRVDLRIADEQWVPKSEFPGPPNVVVLGTETKLDGKNLVVSGRVINRDTKVISQIQLVAVFRNQFQLSAGASETRLENLAPNESRAFSILHPAIANVDLAGTSVFAYAK